MTEVLPNGPMLMVYVLVFGAALLVADVVIRTLAALYYLPAVESG